MAIEPVTSSPLSDIGDEVEIPDVEEGEFEEPGDVDDGDEGVDGDTPDDDEDGDISWVTAAVFWTPTEAQLARIRLESEGIRVLILNENFVATDWMLANAVGGIKVQVPDSELPVARSLLARSPNEFEQSEEPVADGQDRCVRCGSPDIYATWFSRRWSIVALFVCVLLLPFAMGSRKRCSACGYEWSL